MERTSEESPRPRPRVIGGVWLLYFLTAFSAAFLMKGLVVPGDAAGTASAILAHTTLYRSGLAVDLLSNAVYLALTVLLYRLFEPVNRGISLLAAFFSLVGCAVQIFGGVLRLAPLLLLQDNHWLSAFTPEQVQALALLFIKLHAQTFNGSLVLFAVFDLLIGYLILKSLFLPRALGVLMMIAGLGWLTFVWPPLATALSWFILPLGAMAELLLMLWLLVRGAKATGS